MFSFSIIYFSKFFYFTSSARRKLGITPHTIIPIQMVIGNGSRWRKSSKLFENLIKKHVIISAITKPIPIGGKPPVFKTWFSCIALNFAPNFHSCAFTPIIKRKTALGTGGVIKRDSFSAVRANQTVCEFFITLLLFCSKLCHLRFFCCSPFSFGFNAIPVFVYVAVA